MRPTEAAPDHADRRNRRIAGCLLLLALCVPACAPVDEPGGQNGPIETTGPGRRRQELALSPEQELRLGRQAYREILSRSRVLPRNSDDVRRVTRVGERIARASEIEPLQREIGLHFDPAYLEWEFNVVEDNHINAFCLPGGKVVVFTGLLRVVEYNDDFLATVLSHEIAHALAHHASERIASQQMVSGARAASEGDMGALGSDERGRMIDVVAGIGSQLYGLSAERRQESEADHIGLFLMAFAGYDPLKAVLFWDRMLQISQGRGTPIEILSDHPSDSRRIAQIQAWARGPREPSVRMTRE